MTQFHSAYFAHELTKRHSVQDSEKLASVLADAQVDLNPHQLDAALFAFKSPLSKGSILADEVGLGKTIEAGLVIAQKWAEDKRRGLKSELKDFDDEITLLKKEARLALNLPEKLATQKRIRDLDAKPEQIEEQLKLHIDHIDHKATPEDLLFEILIKAGFMPTEKVQTITLAGIPVFSIADGGLLICLTDTVTKDLINAVAESEPMQFICLDKVFGGNDQLKANAVQTFNARNMGKEKHNQIIFRTV